MKTVKRVTVALVLSVGLGGYALARAADPAPAPEVPKPEETAPAKEETPPPSPVPAAKAEAATPAAATAAKEGATAAVEDVLPAAGGEGLRLNFRGVPLETVLEYLADAAGFTIVLETEVRGKVDVWSNQPLTKEEAVTLVNSVLNRNGYAAIRDGRTLTIIRSEEAKKRDIPVRSGADPANIPKTDDIVTQIIPVRFINAVQLIKDLQQLLPEKATIAANEGGNAIIITDSQVNIRRLTEIVKALDTAIASVSTVRVFPLRYADAKTLANVIKEVFQSPETTQRGNLQAQILNRFRGFGGGGPGGGGNGGGGEGSGNTGGRPGASRVTAVADERSNALVVGAPDDLIPTIEEVVQKVDAPVEDITEVRVFRLKNSDPVEMADLLTNLFPDDTQSSDTRSPVRFGGGAGGPFGGNFGRGGNNAANQASDRMKKQGRVLAVPDQRTSSVVVSAARDLMDQISQMVTQLDASPAKKQKVFVYPLENADPTEAETILRGLFETQNSRNTTRNTTTRQNTNPLNTRTTGQNTGTGLGTTFGSGGLGGGQNQR